MEGGTFGRFLDPSSLAALCTARLHSASTGGMSLGHIESPDSFNAVSKRFFDHDEDH